MQQIDRFLARRFASYLSVASRTPYCRAFSTQVRLNTKSSYGRALTIRPSVREPDASFKPTGWYNTMGDCPPFLKALVSTGFGQVRLPLPLRALT